MNVQLGSIHWVYLLFILLIIGFMVKRKDTTVVCMAGIFVLGLLATHNIEQSLSGLFDSFVYAIKELLGTILVISIIVGMSRVLINTGIHETMISPVAKLIQSPGLAFWIVGLVMMIRSFRSSSGLLPRSRSSVQSSCRSRCEADCRPSALRWR